MSLFVLHQASVSGEEHLQRVPGHERGLHASLEADAAEEHLSEIDDPMVRDQAALGMMQSLYEDLDRAERLYDGISAGPSRIKAANLLYRRWSNIDSVRAQTCKIASSDRGN